MVCGMEMQREGHMEGESKGRGNGGWVLKEREEERENMFKMLLKERAYG